MSEKLDEAPAPAGAPSVRTDRTDRPHFEPARPRMGGLATPVIFDADESAVIEAVADTMIPPGGGFPAPHEVGIVDFFGRYTTPTGYAAKHYPFVEEDFLKALLSDLGAEFVSADENGRTGTIARLEREREEDFTKLRALVYYGYYAAPEVTTAISQQIPSGRDYHGPPLPYGYAHLMEDWDDEALATAGQGSYVETDDVVRVDLSKVPWIQEKEKKA